MRPQRICAPMTHEEEELAWYIVVGRLFLLFGSIEYHSYQWIKKLSRDAALPEMSSEIAFCKRVKVIHSLVRQSKWSAEKKRKATEIWNSAKDISERVRNVVAHNPLYVVKDSGKRTPHIINTKKIRWVEPTLTMERSTILSWDDICKAGTITMKLAEDLGYFDFKD